MNLHPHIAMRINTPINDPGQRQRRRGFTLIELLLVLVILGVLAGIVVPRFAGRTEQARRTAAAADIAAISTALDAFEVDNGYYPKSLADLVEQPRDAQNWKGPYLRNGVPLDPWKNAYSYQYPGRHNPNGYDIMSMGFDGREGTDDDLTNWQQPSQTQR